MAILERLQMILTHIQFIALLNHLDFDWPASMRDLLNIFNSFNLDFTEIMIEYDLPRVDFRAMFTLVGVVLPIAIILSVLVIFNKIYVVVWYAVLVVGFIIGAVGAIGYYLPSATGFASEQSIAMGYMTIGAAIFITCLFVAAIYKIRKAQKDNSLEAQEREATRFNPRRSAVHFASCFFPLLIGLIFYGIIDTSVTGYAVSGSTTQSSVVRIIAIVCMVIGAMAGLYFLINITPPGRRMTYVVTKFIHGNLLKAMFVIISASYIPVISYCVNMFMCVEYSCPEGTKFNPFITRSPGNLSRSDSMFCDPCVFSVADGIASCPNSVAELCPAFSDRRLVRYPDITCSMDAHNYFVVAAALSSIVYCVGVPALIHKTVTTCCTIIRRDVRVVEIPGEEELSADEKWRLQVYMSCAAPSSLYRPFKHMARYFSIIQLAHKLSVVAMLIIVAPFRSDFAIVLTLLFHTAGTIFLFRIKPYLSTMEAALAAILAICSIVNSLYGVYVWQQGDSVPSYTTAIFILLNGVIPVLAFLCVEVLVNRRASKDIQDRVKRVQDLLDKSRANVNAIVVAERMKCDDDKDAVSSEGQTGELYTTHTTHEEEPVETFSNDDNENKAEEMDVPPDGNGCGRGSIVVAMSTVNMGNDAAEALQAATEEEYDAELLLSRLRIADAHNRKVDMEINQVVQSLMTRHFMIMGLICFLAFGFCVLGSLRMPLGEFINPSYGESEAEQLFGGFSSWSEFNVSCCCIENTKHIRGFNLTERWVCATTALGSNKTVSVGKTVSRGRVTTDGEHSGLPIRGLCHRRFNAGCDVFGVDTDVSCSADVASKVTDRALDRYW
eukprot:PhM_4_TR15710/c0_g1_i2/m.28711